MADNHPPAQDLYSWGSREIRKQAARSKTVAATDQWLRENTTTDDQGRVIYNGVNTGKTESDIIREQVSAFDAEWDERHGANPLPPGHLPSDPGWVPEDSGGSTTPDTSPTPSAPTGSPSASAVVSGEITGLQSAIVFAEGSAAAAERAAAQDEAAIAAVQAGGTTGPVIAALQASIEQHQANARHYRAAAEELKRQVQVREAYEATPGAGTKQFVTSE